MNIKMWTAAVGFLAAFELMSTGTGVGSADLEGPGGGSTDLQDQGFWELDVLYEGELSACAPHPDGGIVGVSGGGGGSVTRIDAAGSIVSDFLLEGDNWSFFSCAVPTEDGGWVAGGWFGDKPWICKLDGSLQVRWQRSYKSSDGALRGGLGPVEGIALGDRGSFVARLSSETGAVILMKIAGSGDLIWCRRFGATWGFFVDDAYSSPSLITLAGGEIVVCVNSRGDPFLLELNTDGQLLWVRRLGRKGRREGLRWIEAVRPTADGGFVAAGEIQGRRALRDIWLLKMNRDGTLTWESSYRTFDEDGFEQDWIVDDICVADDGSLFLVAIENSALDDALLLVSKFSPVGKPTYSEYGWFAGDANESVLTVSREGALYVYVEDGYGGYSLWKMDPEGRPSENCIRSSWSRVQRYSIGAALGQPRFYTADVAVDPPSDTSAGVTPKSDRHFRLCQ